VRHRVLMGWCLTGLALALLVTGIAGSAPWVAGTEIGCREAGPSSFFLFCWLGSVGLAAVAIACFVTAQAGRVMPSEGLRSQACAAGGRLVVLVVIVDGIQECGF